MPARLKITIRHAKAEDRQAVIEINDSAFGGSAESALIAALEQSGRPFISLIALADSVPVGHIFFSPIRIHCSGPPIATAALAPMAVSPRFQRCGVGSQLVEAGDAFMATELVTGALGGRSGVVEYPDEFASV